MPGIEIKDKEELTPQWGFPLKLEFAATRQADTYTILPNTIKIVGSAGATLHFPDPDRVWVSKPIAAFYYNGRKESSRAFPVTDNNNRMGTLKIKVKHQGEYRIELKAKLHKFGEVVGEFTR